MASEFEFSSPRGDKLQYFELGGIAWHCKFSSPRGDKLQYDCTELVRERSSVFVPSRG